MRRLTLLATLLMTFAATAHAQRLPTVEPLPVNKLESNIAYIQLRNLGANLAESIRPTFQLAAKMKPRGIIIDLRGNQGGDINTVHAVFESLLPKGTPYMRHVTATYRRIVPTTQLPVIKKSTPIVVLRDAGTGNESDIVVYILQKLRGAGVLEFTKDRSALKRTFKQQARMDQYRPIKESVFFVTPEIRLIANEGAGPEDVIARAIGMIREMSPWEETKIMKK
ncbi:MAG: hypothetical protein HOO67_02990 [Candidatus Peribacteraceae bacterium]|nr:hypothetical protein [Candidatus Peribacteraceae bacterium]